MNVTVVKHDLYRDSVFLMQLAHHLKEMEGIDDSAIMMATEANKDTLKKVGYLPDSLQDLKPSDLLIAVSGDSEEHIEAAVKQAEEVLAGKKLGGKSNKKESSEDTCTTIQQAMEKYPESKFIVISVPGAYAAAEARQALHQGLNVLLFSDNVSKEQEIDLKKTAIECNRLLMGPDCGTAIIDGIPLGFANKIRKGHIGVVGASGTGTQECTTVLSQYGYGFTQVIGTGGRDLSNEVGGMTMITGIKMLLDDPETNIIVVISKPPKKEVADKILDILSKANKKIVLNFIGYKPENLPENIICAADADEILNAVNVFEGVSEKMEKSAFWGAKDKLVESYKKEVQNLKNEQNLLVGLYSGGTLCDEAQVIVKDAGIDLISENLLTYDAFNNSELTDSLIEDLGDDEYTRGRPHPMIDMELRKEMIGKAAKNKNVAVILADIELGYGSHSDPAGEIAGAIKKAKDAAASEGRSFSAVVTVCGTADDKQGYDESVRKLEEAGAIVLPTNKQAALMAACIAKRDSDTIMNSLYCIPSSAKSAEAGAAYEMPVVLNIGLEIFADDMADAGAEVHHIAWKPIYGGNEVLAEKLSRIM